MKSALMICLAMLLVFKIAAQDYVVTAKGDTVKGKIKIVSFDQLDRVVINGNNKKALTALQVRVLNIENENYRAMKYENSIRFMKVIKTGYLSLLAFRPNGQGGWDGRYVFKNDGAGMELPNLAFKKSMAKFLSDCPVMEEKLDKGEFGKRDIERIIDLYNACIQTKTDEKMSNRESEPKPTERFENLEKVTAIKNLIQKVDKGDFLSKEDASDLLKDVLKKVEKGEKIPNYLTEGLKSYLGNTPLNGDLESLLDLLKK